jgi:hypothetical protein
LKRAKEPVLHGVNLEILFLLHLKKGTVFSLGYLAQSSKDGQQKINGKTKEKGEPKEPQEPFVDCFGTLKKSEVS